MYLLFEVIVNTDDYLWATVLSGVFTEYLTEYQPLPYYCWDLNLI